MKTYYYVDSENVHYNLDALLRVVKRYDRVVYCYSVANPCIQCHYLEEFAKKRVKVLFLECQVGSSNAMDFQIVMQMVADYMSGKADAVRVYSNDHGFVIPMKAWADRGFNFGVLHPDAEIVPKKTIKPEPPVVAVTETVEVAKTDETLLTDIIAAVGKEDGYKVYEAIKHSGGSLVQYNSELQTRFHGQSQHAGKLYHATKHFMYRWNATGVASVVKSSVFLDDVKSCAGKKKFKVVFDLIKQSQGSIDTYNSLLYRHYRPNSSDDTVSKLFNATKHLVARWKEG